MLTDQTIGSQFVVYPPKRRQQRQRRIESESDDPFYSDYEDELGGLTGYDDDPADQHPSSDINLLHLVQVI